MYTLTLIRHAKSSWDDPSLDDFDRPLNARGRRDAPFMGRLLHEQGVRFDLLVSSPARRALDTAREIARQVGYPPEAIRQEPAIYEASPGGLLAVVHALPAQARSVGLVGHNPGLSLLAQRLSREPVPELKTCAYVRLAFEVPDWSAVGERNGRLLAFEYPKKYPKARRLSGST